MNTPRIVLFGPMGIGKSTAVRALCGESFVDCDVANLDVAAHAKPTTTVGADFGTVRIGGGEELQVYGSPGQGRFNFVREWLLSLAIGAMVLVDIGEEDALAQVGDMLDDVQRGAPQASAMVLVARPAPPEAVQHFAASLAERAGWAVPVVPVDVRDPAQMLDALELLVAALPD